MSSPSASAHLARAAVELTVRALPTWEDRLRYRGEFLADLDALSPAEQLRYAAGVLSQTFALRAALGASPARVEEDAMDTKIPTFRRFRCRFLRWHDWQTMSNPDGERYRACSVCEKDEPRYDAGHIGMGGGFGGL
jgi:hypothetical protein